MTSKVLKAQLVYWEVFPGPTFPSGLEYEDGVLSEVPASGLQRNLS